MPRIEVNIDSASLRRVATAKSTANRPNKVVNLMIGFSATEDVNSRQSASIET